MLCVWAAEGDDTHEHQKHTTAGCGCGHWKVLTRRSASQAAVPALPWPRHRRGHTGAAESTSTKRRTGSCCYSHCPAWPPKTSKSISSAPHSRSAPDARTPRPTHRDALVRRLEIPNQRFVRQITLSGPALRIECTHCLNGCLEVRLVRAEGAQ